MKILAASSTLTGIVRKSRKIPVFGKLVCMYSILIFTLPITAGAQTCPGTMESVGTGMFSAFARRSVIGAFPSSVPNCFLMPTGQMTYTGTPFGTNPPNICTAVIRPSTIFLAWRALWPLASASGNTTMNGCDFNCPNTAAGSCQVRGGSGLPVELMEFSVEPDKSD